MPFAEDLSVFFNCDEFGTLAVINGKPVLGIFNYGTVLVNEVETRKPIFTCAEAEVANINQDISLQIQQQSFKVITIKLDGTGCAVLVLEKLFASE